MYYPYVTIGRDTEVTYSKSYMHKGISETEKNKWIEFIKKNFTLISEISYREEVIEPRERKKYHV